MEAVLSGYRELVSAKLLGELPRGEPEYAYSLLSAYPRRPGKGLRPTLCLATCDALGGDVELALNSAIAIELFHNAFLIHDDVQDQSEMRRGRPTLNAEHGVAIALNVGNMTNLAGLYRLFNNRPALGAALSWRIFQETELMMRHSLEGQAIELGWIKDNASSLVEDDYFRMCLKKTSWYTCIYPCRIGALVARGDTFDTACIDQYGWYLGAAFQIQDDVLNLMGDYGAYGKEIGGDLWEGKRTLMLLRLQQLLRGAELRRLQSFLSRSRQQRDAADVTWLRERMIETGCIQHARDYADQLSAEALRLGREAFGGLPDSAARNFLLELPRYMVERDH